MPEHHLDRFSNNIERIRVSFIILSLVSSYSPYNHQLCNLTDVKLLRGVDPRKDQTFFLSQIPQNALRNTMFPIGSINKSEVKQMAAEIGLQQIVKKRESMGICFIGKRKFSDFMNEYVSSKPGDFVNIETGAILGKHNGIAYYTIGQKALVEGQKDRTYIVRKMLAQNVILVAPGRQHPSMLFDIFYTDNPHWIDGPPFECDNRQVVTVEFRFQHGHKLKKCKIIRTDNGLLVKLDEPLRAICSGQFAVFYRNEECLGSARISASGPSIQQNLDDEAS